MPPTQWPTCQHSAKCKAAPILDTGFCAAHVEDEHILTRAGAAAYEIDLRGARISGHRVEWLLKALGSEHDPASVLALIADQAQFDGGLDLRGIAVQGSVRLSRARIVGDLQLGGITIDAHLRLESADIVGAVRSGGARVRGDLIAARARVHGSFSLSSGSIGRNFRVDGLDVGGDTQSDGLRVGGNIHADGARFRGRVRFDTAHVEGSAELTHLQLDKTVTFRQAVVSQRLSLVGTKIAGRATFDRADVGEDMLCDGCSFGGPTIFNRMTVKRHARFAHAIFSSDVRFDRMAVERGIWFSAARFSETAIFRGMTVGREARFENAAFDKDARLEGVAISGAMRLDGMSVAGDLSLSGSDFIDSQIWGPVSIGQTLRLDRANFSDGVDAQVIAAVVDLTSTRFRGESTLAFDGSAITADNTSFRHRCLISGNNTSRLISLRGGDVSNLALGDLDLTECRFSGAHRLDSLRLESGCRFLRAPRGPRAGLAVPPVWWWSSREVLYEEALVRHHGTKPAGWHVAKTKPPDGLPSATTVARIYRSLRKGREDTSDAPGAADLYYGEMDMRRVSRSIWHLERFLLGGYRAISGYGVRPARAAVSLVLLLALSVVLFMHYGFQHPNNPRLAPLATTPTATLIRAGQPSYAPPSSFHELANDLRSREAWTYVVETALPGTRTSGVRLTPTGRALAIGLRIGGALFLGLLVLAIRSRIKR